MKLTESGIFAGRYTASIFITVNRYTLHDGDMVFIIFTLFFQFFVLFIVCFFIEKQKNIKAKIDFIIKTNIIKAK
jgi:hypothetical protein